MSRNWIGEWNWEEREERIPDRNSWKMPGVARQYVMRLKEQIGCTS